MALISLVTTLHTVVAQFLHQGVLYLPSQELTFSTTQWNMLVQSVQKLAHH